MKVSMTIVAHDSSRLAQENHRTVFSRRKLNRR